MDRQQELPPVRLLLTEDIQALLQQRGIIETYIMEVIRDAERSSNKLLNVDSGRFIGHKRIGHITCWVEYQKEEEAYRVYNAYMHRMEIEGEDEAQYG